MNIVILDRRSLGDDTPVSSLAELGNLTVYDETRSEDIVARLVCADVVVINKVRLTAEILAQCPTLRLICLFATGYDNVDVAAARERGIAVCNVPGYSTESVALFTVSTVLALASHLFEYNAFVKSGEYSASGAPNRLTPVYHELRGKVWGIVGLGNIGSRVAELATALGAKVIVNKRTPTDKYTWVDIDTLCRESDIITLHCPLNGESRAMINEKRLSLMKPDVILVNEARGGVVDESAVANAVADGRIAAFGSDVYSTEPFGQSHPYYDIMGRDNVILTPHAAWGSYESRLRCIGIIRQNIDSFLSGKSLNRVDI